MPRPLHARTAPSAALRRRAWATLLALATLLGGCGPSGPTGPSAETLAALRVTVGTATPHTPIPVTITAIGNRGSDPLPDFDATVTLEVDAGSIDATTVGLADGVGQVDLTFAGAVGPVTLTASAGAVTTSVVVDLQPLTVVPGDPSDPLADALPYLAYLPRPDEYAADAPDLPGLPMSTGTILATIDPTATIGDLNALLDRHDARLAGFVPDPSGTVGALVALRLPTTNHAELLPLLTALAAEPLVRHAHRDLQAPDPDPQEAEPTTSGIGRSELPQPREGDPAGWTWELDSVTPQPNPDANWGLEAIRMPQAWNLNAAIADAPDLPTGVLDSGFLDHPDLDLTILGAADAPEDASHGVHVAGTIGARFDNGQGVDGVNPVARLTARRYVGGSAVWDMIDFIQKRPTLRVVNASIGVNWHKLTPPRNPNTSEGSQAEMNDAGRTVADFLTARRAAGLPTPIIVAAAGNSSGKSELAFAIIEARWGSPFANAALEHGAPGIVVVEAVQRALNDPSLLVRAGFSSVGGHISAPGVAIVSTVPGTYAPKSGTSMAAPHVTGLLGLLLAHAGDDLTPDQVIATLLATARPAASSNTAPVVDAFAALLALDVQLGQPFQLRRLADTDDGTPDGNLRRDPFTGDPIDVDTLALRGLADFGLAGDGTIDMRDFRRFRDALLAAENAPDLALDGDPLHDKRDLNRDGRVQNATLENVFPRHDLNGDGIIHRTATIPVGGLLLDAPTTDLQVLQFVWQDPDVDAADLPDLLDSGDVHLDGTDALGVTEAAAVEIEFLGPTPRSVRLTPGEPTAVVTLAIGAYDLELRYLDTQDAVLVDDATTALVELGGDVGIVLEDPLATEWTSQFGTDEDDEASDVAVDSVGHVYVVGITQGKLDDRAEIEPLGIEDAFVRKHTGDGQVLWTRQFGTAFNDQNNQVAVDATDHVLIASQQGLDNQLVVVKLDPEGDQVWRSEGPFSINLIDMAVDADGNAYVVGGVGLGTSFVIKFTSTGSLEWQASIPTSTPRAVVVDGDGLVVVVGGATAALDGESFGEEDAFLRWFDAAGEDVRTLQFGTAARDNLLGVALAPDGRLFVAGSTRGALAPGQGSPGTLDGFVRLLEADGTEVWTLQYGTPGADFPTSIAVRPDGSAVVAGWTTGALAGPHQGGIDVAVLWFADDGEQLGGRQFGTPFDEYGLSVAADAGGGALIVGHVVGTTDLFGPGLGGFGDDAFVARIFP